MYGTWDGFVHGKSIEHNKVIVHGKIMIHGKGMIKGMVCYMAQVLYTSIHSMVYGYGWGQWSRLGKMV